MVWLDHMVGVCLSFKFSKVVAPLYPPQQSMRGSSGFMSSLAFSMVSIFHLTHSNRCAAVYHCSFNLRLSSDS